MLLGHMGGPLWAKKDDGAWSFFKGELDPDETLIDGARREFVEETGLAVPTGELISLGAQRSGAKTIHLFAIESDLSLEGFTPGTFEMQWPPRSGHVQTFPEIDRLAWFSIDEARRKLTKNQQPFVDALATIIKG